MRESEKDLLRLHHILEAINNVNKFMKGKAPEELEENPMLYFAVVKNIEIIGEAAYMLTSDFINSHPQTPWKFIIKMRHILVHGYYQIEAHQLYNVYSEDLPLLKPQIEEYIKNFNK
ncbi:MAG: DUF86 domain-containing protein [Muribaculaceae bacterium]|nr:DUF86 domain-containing protein [Muribaculaceae bacterium]